MKHCHGALVLTACVSTAAPTTAGSEELPFGGQEFIYESASFPECHASTLLELEGGGILAAWFGGTGEGHRDVAIWTAKRKGQAAAGEPLWSPPRQVASDPAAPTWNPVLARGVDGKVWLFYKLGPSPERWSGAYMTSPDEGETFDKAVFLPAGLLGPIKNKPLALPAGGLLCGSSVESYGTWAVWVERLASDGKSWSKAGPIVVPGHLHGVIQPALFQGEAPGEVVMLMRSRGIGKVCRAHSRDEGATWSPAEPIDLPHPNSGIDAVRLKDGRVVLAHNHTTVGRTPLNLALSKDLGRTWSRGLVLENAPGEYSYPAVVELKDGGLGVAYTWKRKRIRFARVPLAALGEGTR